MMVRLLALFLTLGATACARERPPLSKAVGDYRPLNAGRWTPLRDDLRGPRAPLAPSASPNITPETGK